MNHTALDLRRNCKEKHSRLEVRSNEQSYRCSAIYRVDVDIQVQGSRKYDVIRPVTVPRRTRRLYIPIRVKDVRPEDNHVRSSLLTIKLQSKDAKWYSGWMCSRHIPYSLGGLVFLIALYIVNIRKVSGSIGAAQITRGLANQYKLNFMFW